MREWRVGTLSMGLLLMGTGVGLLYAQLNSIAVVDLAVKWWPLIFIILGAEVLVQHYFRKNEDSKIKYDVFSIFIIIIIVLTGVATQTASEFGLMAYVQNELKSQNYELTTTTTKVNASKTRNIIIHAENIPNIIVRDSSAQEVSIYGRGNLRAESRDAALNRLAEGVRVSSRQEGDTLYVDLEASMNLFDYYLTLPGNIAVEMDLNGTSAELSPNRLGSNWIVKDSSNTKVTLLPDTNLMVSVLDTDLESVHGNVAWLNRDGKTLAELRQLEQAGPPNGEINENYHGDSDQHEQLKAVLGKADHKLTLLGAGNVTVNVLP